MDPLFYLNPILSQIGLEEIHQASEVNIALNVLKT